MGLPTPRTVPGTGSGGATRQTKDSG
jgi:hypothetical protein